MCKLHSELVRYHPGRTPRGHTLKASRPSPRPRERCCMLYRPKEGRRIEGYASVYGGNRVACFRGLKKGGESRVTRLYMVVNRVECFRGLGDANDDVSGLVKLEFS
jgi:hypothetical protein